MIILKANTAYDIHFSTRDTDGNAADATGTPTAILFAGNTSLSGTVTVTVSSVSTGMYNASFTTPADISSYLGKTASLDISAMISTVAAKANKVIGMFDTKITSDNYAILTDGDYGLAQLVRATTPANTLDVSSTGEAGIDFSNIKQATGATTLTNITVPTVTTLTGHTPQTGDSYAVVTNTTYGLAKLVRATTPANTLDIDANGEVTVGAFNSNLSFTTNQNNAIASYSGQALHSYGTAKTSDLASLATSAALATVDNIVDAILVDTGTTIPAQITGLNDTTAQEVWEYATRTLTSAGSGGATAQEVWEYATRSLTDKSGFSLTQSFPANFASLDINASGHISRVTLVDTTTTNTDMRGTDGAITSLTGIATSTNISDLQTHGDTNWATADVSSLATTSQLTEVQKYVEADIVIDTTTTPYKMIIKQKGTETVLATKLLKKTDGTNVTSLDDFWASQTEEV